MEMALTGLLDESFSSFTAILEGEGEGEYGFYSTMDGNEGALEAILGSSLMCPDGSVLSNVGESFDAFHHLDCSITTIAQMLENPEGSDQLGLWQRRAEIESGFHKNGGIQKMNGIVGGSGANAPQAANNNNNNGNVSVASVGRGRKNGLPAKNLMAERRRRKKLNDRLFMLRSVVPKVSKQTDRTSILGDAVEYLKELLQRINGLHTELMSGSSNSKPLASTLLDFPCMMNREYQASLLNPEVEPARVEVKTREGKTLNIHMFCSKKPGLLLSTISALDGLGLDVKQAVISCFNGFALDVFLAEQPKGNVTAEEIKALLLHTAGYQAAGL